VVGMRKKLVYALVLIVLTGAVIEGLLHLLCLVSPRVDVLLSRSGPVATVIDDARLGHRPDPAFSEHDAKGFRNPSVPEQATIVVLGDSQTYGINAAPFQAWPRELARVCGKTTYSMAYGGYGPVHYALLLEEALALRPGLVIVALYAGNDLWEAYERVYSGGQLAQLKSGSLLTETTGGADANRGDLENDLSRLTKQVQENLTADPQPVRSHGSMREFLADRSKLYGLVRAGRRLYQSRFGLDVSALEHWPSLKEQALKNPDSFLVVEQGAFRTIVTPRYRLSVLDLENPVIAEGLRVSLKALDLIHERVAGAGAGLLVVLIPTKEYVVQDYVLNGTSPVPDAYSRVVRNEETMWRSAKTFLADRSIASVDTRGALWDCIRAGRNPYLLSGDGHPNPVGYTAIANAVCDALQGNSTIATRLQGAP
jgi:hypothetical protein